jgi:hypothetical protein
VRTIRSLATSFGAALVLRTPKKHEALPDVLDRRELAR